MQNILVLKQKGRLKRPFLSDAKTFFIYWQSCFSDVVKFNSTSSHSLETPS